MAEPAVIIDAGPLVAFLVAQEQHHDWSATQFTNLPAPFITCEPVLAEAFHLVRRAPLGTRRLIDLVSTGLLTSPIRVLDEWSSLQSLIVKYERVPMSLADACLVRLCEIYPRSRLLTLDGDFRIYRKNRRQRIPLIAPFDVAATPASRSTRSVE